jgi:hypothetical protein
VVHEDKSAPISSVSPFIMHENTDHVHAEGFSGLSQATLNDPWLQLFALLIGITGSIIAIGTVVYHTVQCVQRRHRRRVDEGEHELGPAHRPTTMPDAAGHTRYVASPLSDEAANKYYSIEDGERNAHSPVDLEVGGEI